MIKYLNLHSKIYIFNSYLSENKGDHITWFPETRMKKLGKGIGWKGVQDFRAVEDVVQTFVAPPSIGYWKYTKSSSVNKVRKRHEQ